MILEMDVVFDDKSLHVLVRIPIGMPSGYHIYINDVDHGMMLKSCDGIWLAYLHERSILTGDDIMIIGQMLDEGGL